MGDVGRDPRVDPRTGDVLEGAVLRTVKVIAIMAESHTVHFEIEGVGHDYRPLKAWRAWAKSATVVKKGEPE